MPAFFYELDRNVEVVDDFFTKKNADIQRRFKLLIDKYGDSKSDQLDSHELEDLVSSFTMRLIPGRRSHGITFPNAKTPSTHFFSTLGLMIVVCGREQTRLHQDPQKVFFLPPMLIQIG